MLSYLRVQMERNQWEFAQLAQCGLPRGNLHGVHWDSCGSAPTQPEVPVGGLTLTVFHPVVIIRLLDGDLWGR